MINKKEAEERFLKGEIITRAFYPNNTSTYIGEKPEPIRSTTFDYLVSKYKEQLIDQSTYRGFTHHIYKLKLKK